MNKQFYLSGLTNKTALCTAILLTMLSSYAVANDMVNVLPTITIVAEEDTVAYKSGNMDIPRTEDDVQAYTIINREKIENSGAKNVADLISKVLPMATSGSDSTDFFNTTSTQINMRGLGASQTLVLINGRRNAGVGNRGSSEATDQPNLNNIPLAAIERIEVLPTSAAAIYGSGAIGGVINVILRRDYVGTEIDVNYANAIDGKQDVKSASIVSGFALEDGRTNVMFTASTKKQGALSAGERKFTQQAIDRIKRNNPDAIYNLGYPPGGPLVNIMSGDGSELFAGWGSDVAHIPKGWNGSLSELGHDFSVGLADAAGDGWTAWTKAYPLIEAAETDTFSLSLNRDFTDRLNLFLEASYDREKTKNFTRTFHGHWEEYVPGEITDVNGNTIQNPNNPFGKDVVVTFPINWSDMGEKAYRIMDKETKRLATGFHFDLTPSWLVTGDYAWSSTDNYMAFTRQGRNNPKAKAWQQDMQAGLINIIRDTTTSSTADYVSNYWNYPHTYTKQSLHDIALRTSGSIYKWYAGDIKLATGLEYRRLESDGYAEWGYVDNPWIEPTEIEQNAASIYAELNIPFIAPEQNLSFAHLFDMQIAGRYEEFKMNSATPEYTVDTATGYNSILQGYHHDQSKYDAFSPTVGFRFAPNKQLMLRASYSEGFVTPTVTQVSTPSVDQVTNGTVTDPVTGEVVRNYESISGGNPNITPEKSKSINAGLVLTPTIFPKLRLSIDYFDIKKSNNISEISAQTILNNPNVYGSRIKRDVNGKVASIDTTYINALTLETSGIDTSLSYLFDTPIGETTFSLGYTYTDKFLMQSDIELPAKDYVGIAPNWELIAPLKHRANASIDLKANDMWSFGWASQYYHSYQIDSDELQYIKNQGTAKIESQIYHDIYTRVNLLPAAWKSLDSAVLTFGIQNLFNDFTVDMSQEDYYLSKYSSPLGRNYYLNLKFTF